MFLCLSLLARSFSMGVKKSRCWRQSTRIGEKRLWRRNKKREKRGLSFFSPLYSFCFLYVFRLSRVPIQQKMRTKFSGMGLRFLCSFPTLYFVSFFSRTPPPVRFIASRLGLEDWSGRFRIIKSVCLSLCLGNYIRRGSSSFTFGLLFVISFFFLWWKEKLIIETHSVLIFHFDVVI